MFRIISQVLIGLMLVFGALTLVPRALFYVGRKDAPRSFYFLFLISVALFFAVMAFFFAYDGIRGLFL